MATREIYNLAALTATAATNTPAASGGYFLHSVVIPKATTGTVTFADAANTTLFLFPAATVAGTYIFDSIFPSGFHFVTNNAADTVIVNGSAI